jgi:membrane-associated protein
MYLHIRMGGQMDFDGIVQEVLNIVGTFNLKLAISLFLLCAIGEFGLFSIPYLLETIWLISGYNLGSGILAPFHMILLWLVAQAGRQTGATLLYVLGQYGSMPFKKLYHRYFEPSLTNKYSSSNVMPFRFFSKLDYLSPFSIALGRLIGLRIPLTITLGAKKQFRTLLLGVLLSSLIWDGVYIILGLAGGRTALKPTQMVLYSLIGLTILYVVTFSVRQLKRRLPGTVKITGE